MLHHKVCVVDESFNKLSIKICSSTFNPNSKQRPKEKVKECFHFLIVKRMKIPLLFE